MALLPKLAFIGLLCMTKFHHVRPEGAAHVTTSRLTRVRLTTGIIKEQLFRETAETFETLTFIKPLPTVPYKDIKAHTDKVASALTRYHATCPDRLERYNKWYR